MAEHLLKKLDITTLMVAMDHVLEFGPAEVVPDLATAASDCVYLRYIGEDQLAVFVARLPSVRVMFRTPAVSPNTKVVRHIFYKPSVFHVLRFMLGPDADGSQHVKEVGSVSKKYWRIMEGDADPFQRRKKA